MQYNKARDLLLVAMTHPDTGEALAALLSARSAQGFESLHHELEATSAAEYAALESEFDTVYAGRTDNADGTDGNYPHMPGKYDHSSNGRANPDDILKGNGLDQYPGTKVTFLMDGKIGNSGDSPNDPALSNMQDAETVRQSNPEDVELDDIIGDGDPIVSTAPGEFNYALDGEHNNNFDVSDFTRANNDPNDQDTVRGIDDVLDDESNEADPQLQDIPFDDDGEDVATESEQNSSADDDGDASDDPTLEKQKKPSWTDLEGRDDDEMVNPQLADVDDSCLVVKHPDSVIKRLGDHLKYRHDSEDNGAGYGTSYEHSSADDDDDVDDEDDDILDTDNEDFTIFDDDPLYDPNDDDEDEENEQDDDDEDHNDEDYVPASVDLPNASQYPVQSAEDMPVKIWDRGEQVSDVENDGDDDVRLNQVQLADTDTNGEADELDIYPPDVNCNITIEGLVPGEYWYKHRAVEDAAYHLQEQDRFEKAASEFTTLHMEAKRTGNTEDARNFHKQFEHAKRWAGLHGTRAQELLRLPAVRRKPLPEPHGLS